MSVNATTTTIDRKDNLIIVPLANYASTRVPRINANRRTAVSSVNLGLVQAAIRLVHSLVISRLDYANALLFGITDVLIGKLQRVQNYAARLVVRCDRRDHITPILKKLHWLPVKQRVTYKIILLTFRALNGLAPIYIVDMLHRHRPTRALRSADNNDLQVPSTSSRYGDRTFAASAPRLWNALPRELKIATSLISFKILLKTHLFRIAYEQ